MDWLGGGEGVLASCNYLVGRECILGFGGEGGLLEKRGMGVGEGRGGEGRYRLI